MLEEYIDDITKGTLLFLEETRLMDVDGKEFKKFPNGVYCLYLGYSRSTKLHLLLCEDRVFRLNGYGILTKTFIIQN